MKKTISLLLSVLICVTMMSSLQTFAVDDPTISCTSVTANPEDNVTIEVSIVNNPGIVALQLQVGYDNSKLQLMHVEDGGLLGADSASFGSNLRRNPYSLTWDDSSNTQDHTSDGILAVLTFQILDTADVGDTDLTLSLVQGGTFNADLEDVFFQTVSGTVTITADSPSITEVKAGSVSAMQGEDVDVPIIIENNAGLVAMLLSVAYNQDALQLTGVTDGSLFGAGSALFGNDLSANPYCLLWEDGAAKTNYTGSGTLATLHFHVKDNAEVGNYSIEILVDEESALNVELNAVQIETQNGNINVSEADHPVGQPSIQITYSGYAYSGKTFTLPVMIRNNPGLVSMLLHLSYNENVLSLIDVQNGSVFPEVTSLFGNDLSQVPYSMLWEGGASRENYSENGVLVYLTFSVSEGAVGETEVTLYSETDSTLNMDLEEIEFESETGTIYIDGPIINPNSSVLHVGETLQLHVEGKYVSLDNSTVIWTSSDSTIADVDASGYVVAYRSGNVRITATDVNGASAGSVIQVICPGDADEDGYVTLQDVVVIVRWLAGGWNVTINEMNSDVNRDGEINLKDAVLIRRFLAGGWGVILQ